MTNDARLKKRLNFPAPSPGARQKIQIRFPARGRTSSASTSFDYSSRRGGEDRRDRVKKRFFFPVPAIVRHVPRSYLFHGDARNATRGARSPGKFSRRVSSGSFSHAEKCLGHDFIKLSSRARGLAFTRVSHESATLLSEPPLGTRARFLSARTLTIGESSGQV